MKLVTAEKPSVAGELADALGATERKNGYYEGNGYLVTWAVGHLVGLAEPEVYGYASKQAMWGDEKERAYMELPILPTEYKLVVMERTAEQFDVMKRLMHRADVTEIIDAGDAGDQGFLVQALIRWKAGSGKPVKRFMATSLTKEAINAAMNSLKPIEQYAGIIEGAFCKTKADWVLGMSVSRAASLKHNAGLNIGRVQSPTLNFVVSRWRDAMMFIVKDYFTLGVALGEGFSVYWKKDSADNPAFPQDATDDEMRLINRAAADERVALIKSGGSGTVSSLETAKKTENPPQLYDIAELERDGNRFFNLTAAQTLDIAQSLYEKHKILSYPRTDSRYITSDLEPYMNGRIEEIASLGGVYEKEANRLLGAQLCFGNRVVNDAKVTDHHALIATEKIKGFNLAALTEDERRIMELVLFRMIVCFSPPCTFEQTKVSVAFPCGMTFAASGRKPIENGFKDAHAVLYGKHKTEQDDKKDDDGAEIFPPLQKGQTVSVSNAFVKAAKTSPPKLHTEATLLTAMEDAGAKLPNGAILKGKGIGTQATRQEIIERLRVGGLFVTERKGKTDYLVPTSKGVDFIELLSITPKLISAEMTALWELSIEQIASGKASEKDFMDMFVPFVKEAVETIKGDIRPLKFKKEKQKVCDCPFCGADVYYGFDAKKNAKGEVIKPVKEESWSYYCSAGCGFRIKSNNQKIVARKGSQLAKGQLEKLVLNGSLVVECKSKEGNLYKAEITFERNPQGDRVWTDLIIKPLFLGNKKG